MLIKWLSLLAYLGLLEFSVFVVWNWLGLILFQCIRLNSEQVFVKQIILTAKINTTFTISIILILSCLNFKTFYGFIFFSFHQKETNKPNHVYNCYIITIQQVVYTTHSHLLKPNESKVSFLVWKGIMEFFK